MNTLGYPIIIVSALCYGSMAIFVRYAYALGVHTFTLLTLRMFFCAVILWSYILIRHPHCLLVERKDLKWLILQGGIGLSFASTSLYSAFRHIDVATASILLYTYPILVSLAAVFVYNEKLNRTKWVSLGLTFIGCLFVLKLYQYNKVDINVVGVLWGLGAGVGYALFNIVGQMTVGKYNSLVVTAYTTSFSAIVFIVMHPPTYLLDGSLTWPIILWGLIIAVVCTVLAISLYLQGISMVGASKAAVISTIEPVFTAFLASLLLGEQLEILQLLGGALILAGVLNLQIQKPIQVVPEIEIKEMVKEAG